MNKTKLVIACRHNDMSNVIKTMEGEYVCKCGVILEEKIPDEGITNVKGNISLYHQVENGGDPRDMQVVNKKLHIYSSSASEFSNICNKLRLADFVRQRAWSIYHTLRTKTYFTRAKCAAFSIYVACRESSWPVKESQIRDAVRSILCVKNAPNMLSVISEMHEDAMRIGINTNDGHSSSYYLNLAISGKQHLFGDRVDYDRFHIRVMNNFAHLKGNHQNRARRAVDIALCEMGLR